jgi:hypothetical protein
VKSVTHVVGVDPGLVHTGVVSLLFKPDQREILVIDRVVQGLDARAVKAVVPLHGVSTTVFVEDYRTRSNFAVDNQMVAGVKEMAHELSGVVVNNTGVKAVVRQPLMRLLGVWNFATTTHHQDLRSAARIAVFGMLKDDALNELVADVVRDHTNGRTWKVR